MLETKRFENLEKLIQNENTKTNYLAVTKSKDVVIGIEDSSREVRITLRKMVNSSPMKLDKNGNVIAVNSNKNKRHVYRVYLQISRSSEKNFNKISEYLSDLIVFNGSNLIAEVDKAENKTYKIDDYIKKDMQIALNFDIEFLFTKLNNKMEEFVKLFNKHKGLKKLIPVAFGVFDFEEFDNMIDQLISGDIDSKEIVDLIELNCAY